MAATHAPAQLRFSAKGRPHHIAERSGRFVGCPLRAVNPIFGLDME